MSIVFLSPRKGFKAFLRAHGVRDVARLPTTVANAWMVPVDALKVQGFLEFLCRSGEDGVCLPTMPRTSTPLKREHDLDPLGWSLYVVHCTNVMGPQEFLSVGDATHQPTCTAPWGVWILFRGTWKKAFQPFDVASAVEAVELAKRTTYLANPTVPHLVETWYKPIQVDPPVAEEEDPDTTELRTWFARNPLVPVPPCPVAMVPAVVPAVPLFPMPYIQS